MNFGVRLKSERERLGYNQTDFAALAGASKHAQINWEKGTAHPNAAALAEWARAGADVLYMITGVEAQAHAGTLAVKEVARIIDEHGDLMAAQDELGKHSIQYTLLRQMLEAKMPQEEQALLEAFRHAPDDVRKAVLTALGARLPKAAKPWPAPFLAKRPAAKKPSKTIPGSEQG